MDTSPIPTRITIDFRDAIHPSRSWILGIGADGGRADLLVFDQPLAPLARPIALTSACTCPDFCERDHANE